MTQNRSSLIRVLRKELATLVLLGLLGVFFVPLAIYLVGAEIFGDYAGHGFGEFYRDIHSDFRDGQPVVVFLLLSPYLVWQLLRLSFYGFRRMGPIRHSAGPSAGAE